MSGQAAPALTPNGEAIGRLTHAVLHVGESMRVIGAETMTLANAGANCRGCGNALTDDSDSEAHIIPNALGGRLASTGIICRTCNGKLDDIADNALIEAFGHWPTLLNIPRQRGDNPPRTVDTRDGNRVRLDPDGSLMRMNIQYEVQPIAEGHSTGSCQAGGS